MKKLFALLVFLGVFSSGNAQTVRIMVGFPPGGTTDVIARLVASTPYVFVAHLELPVKSFGELVKRMAGVDMVHIAYKGTGAVMPDLLAGRVPMMFENLAVMTPHIRKGSLRPLAVSSARRTPLMPEVPTVAETGMGLEGFEVLGWFALLAPARTPPEVLKSLNAELSGRPGSS